MTTVLDAGVLIGVFDRQDAHHQEARVAVRRLVQEGEPLVVSAVTFAESLVVPARQGRAGLTRASMSIRSLPGLQVYAVGVDVAHQLAAIRAEIPTLKLPDAAVVATARSLGAQRILTTDRRLARQPEATTPRTFLRS